MSKKQILRVILIVVVLLSSIAFSVAAMNPQALKGEIADSITAYSGDGDAPVNNALPKNAADPKWSDVLIYNVAGVTLRPRSSNTAWESTGNCLYSPSGSEWFNTPLNLPDGSKIEYLYLDYYNTSTASADAYLTRYDNLGDYFDLAGIHTSSSGGYFSEESDTIGDVVDNANYSYAINFRPNENSTDMRLCGIRVAYRLP